MLEKLLTTQQLPSWAEEFAQSVASVYQPDCIILFGSVARNTQKPDSDIDVIVVGGDLPATHRERFRLLMRLRPRLAPIQVQTFTCAEWESMMADKHVTVLEALRDGKALHGR
jgi:predicted nucleotidyltransferase